MELFGLALILTVFASVSPSPTKEAREYPFVVSIHRNATRRNYICAGSLIATSWVLTSVNCLPKFAYKIRYGDMITTINSTYSLILKRIHHMSSKSWHHKLGPNHLTLKTNNIALALIEEVLSWQLGRLSANDYLSILGHAVTFFEFGFLPVYKSKIYANKERLFAYRFRNRMIKWKNKKHVNGSRRTPVDTKVLRAGSGIAIKCPTHEEPGPNICVAKKCFDFSVHNPRDLLVAPDYGAPLIYDGKVIGVTSQLEHYYSRFTPVSPYLDWIRDNMKKEMVINVHAVVYN